MKPSTARDKARNIVALFYSDIHHTARQSFEDMIANNLVEERKAALEEAAARCEREADAFDMQRMGSSALHARSLANWIRAMKETK